MKRLANIFYHMHMKKVDVFKYQLWMNVIYWEGKLLNVDLHHDIQSEDIEKHYNGDSGKTG